VDVLYFFYKEVDQSFLPFVGADVEGGGGVGGKVPDDEQNAVADAS